MYCTCGQCLTYSESRRKFNKLRLDAISIPDYVTKKGRSHGARHGKTEVPRESLWPGMRGRDAVRKSTPKVNILQVFTIDFSEIHFIVNHNSQSDGRNKSAKSGMNLRKKIIHTNSLQRKGEDTKGQWYLTLNKAGKNGPMKLRPDFRAAVSIKNRLHRESGGKVEEPIYPEQYMRWHPSSSTSWWDKSEWNWK